MRPRSPRLAPDGYQILLGTVGTQAQNQTLYKAPLYDFTQDFEPVGLAVDVPIILQVKNDFPGDNVPDVIAHIKANASKLSYGSPGAGSSNHLACVLFNAAIGADVTHVPYRASAELFQDMIAGRLDYWCPTTTAAATLGNKVKTIVTFSRRPARRRCRRADGKRSRACRISRPARGLDCSSRRARRQRW